MGFARIVRKGIKMTFDPHKRTRWLYEFASLVELTDWLDFWGVYHPQKELARMWGGWIDQGRLYKVEVLGKRGKDKAARFYRCKPHCDVCKRSLPKETMPSGAWGPGQRASWICDDCAERGE